MSEFSGLTLTDKGCALNTKVGTGSVLLNFTKMVSSSTSYSNLRSLGSIDIVQESQIEAKEVLNDKAVKLTSMFSNASLDAGYYIKTIGLYADDPEIGEILYGVIQETSGNCYMPLTSNTPSSLIINITVTITDSTNVNLTVNKSGYASVKYVNDRVAELKDPFCNITIENQDWENNSYTYEMQGITSEDLPAVWFRDTETALDCGVTAETVEGGILFTCETVPESIISCSVEVKKIESMD